MSATLTRCESLTIQPERAIGGWNQRQERCACGSELKAQSWSELDVKLPSGRMGTPDRRDEEPGYACTVAFSADGAELVVGLDEGSLSLYAVSNQERARRPETARQLGSKPQDPKPKKPQASALPDAKIESSPGKPDLSALVHRRSAPRMREDFDLRGQYRTHERQGHGTAAGRRRGIRGSRPRRS